MRKTAKKELIDLNFFHKNFQLDEIRGHEFYLNRQVSHSCLLERERRGKDPAQKIRLPKEADQTTGVLFLLHGQLN
jgi:hypothetical protein